MHPHPTTLDRDLVLRCIQECLDCVASCTACADVCDATGRILTRQTTPDFRVIRASVAACAVACSACAEECELHAAHHEHCLLCAEMCRSCQQVCDELLAALA